jgi:HlyD family secretion protein
MTATSPERLFSALSDTAGHPADPRGEILFGAAVAAAFFIGLCGWAAVAPMDAATYAPGVVTVFGHRQTVQSGDGGMIASLRVKEGDRVQAGQVLIQFADAQAITQERALTANVLGLEAQIARLTAEQAGAPIITRPAAFAGLNPDDQILADQAMALETRALQADYGADAARRDILRQHAAEANQQIDGYQRQLEANARQYALNEDELKGVESLAARGFAPLTRVRALERSAAGLQGDAGAQSAEIARLRSVAGESRLELLQTANERNQQTEDELRKAQADLQQTLPQLSAARDHLARTRLTAPVSGSVVGLTANTVNGVVAPGQKLMDIVPDRLPMVIEIQVTPRDANDLHLGQATQVRFSSLHSRQIPVLHGALTRISADSVIEERTGRAYYTADVTVPRKELAQLTSVGQDSTLRAGMPVDVVVPLRKRTALQYWLEPLTQSLWRSFREQ